jgi:hypothetical protein
MKLNRILLLAVVVMTMLCAALVWSNVVASGRAHDLEAKLEAKEARLEEVSAKLDRASKKTPDNGTGELLAQRDAEYEQLREAYDKLKEQLGSSSNLNVTLPAVTSTPARANFGAFGRGNMSNFLERIRQQDPERYQQIVQRMQQRQQQATQDYNDQMAALAQRAQNAPTPEEADLVSQITDTLNKINQLRQDRAALADLPADQQQAQAQTINQQIRDAMQDLSTLRDQDRTIQYQKLADDLKLSDPDKQKLVTTIPQILKDTQVSPQRGPGGYGGGGPPTAPPATTPSQQPSTTAK